MAETQMNSIMLADDDVDDCFFFEEALLEITQSVRLTIAHDGVELMSMLSQSENLPDALFLDLNMPRKNGAQCLEEIKGNDRLKSIDVIILSTSLRDEVIARLVQSGAKTCKRKPDDLNLLKSIIMDSLASLPSPRVVG